MELIFIIAFLIAGLILEIKYKVVLYHSMKERLLIVGIVFVVMVGWETINKHIFGVWIFPGPGALGIDFFGLPIELYLFYITSPYFSFVVYELIQKSVDRE